MVSLANHFSLNRLRGLALCGNRLADQALARSRGGRLGRCGLLLGLLVLRRSLLLGLLLRRGRFFLAGGQSG